MVFNLSERFSELLKRENAQKSAFYKKKMLFFYLNRKFALTSEKKNGRITALTYTPTLNRKK